MDYYIKYVLELLANSQMDEQTILANLEKKFSLTETYCLDILNSMVNEKIVVSEFDEDFHNIYTITNLGLDKLNNSFAFNDQSSENDEEDKADNIDYKTLLGDMYNNEDGDNEQDETLSSGSFLTEIKQEEENQKDDKVVEDSSPVIQIKDEPITESDLSDYSRYKINVKKHVKSVKFKADTKEYLRTSILELFTSISLFVFYCLLEGFAYLIISSNNSISYQVNIAFIIYTCVAAIYPIACLIYYLINPARKDANKFNFLHVFKLICLCVGVIVLLVLSLNFLFGLNNLNMIKYIASWLFPILIGITAVMYPVAKLVLIKTNKFNA